MRFKNNLLLKIFIAIVAGIGLGLIANEPILRIFVTFNGIFSQFLKFIIPLIIIGFIIPSIGRLGSGASKMVLVTAFLAYLSTLLAGFLSYGISAEFFPSILGNQTLAINTQVNEPLPYFSIAIPPMFDVMTALVFAFIVGIGVAKIDQSVLLRISEEFEVVISRIITFVLIPLLPVYIFGIFLLITYEGTVFTIINVFTKIIFVIFALHLFYLLFIFSIAGFVAKKNPLRMLYNMLPAYFTALGTQSSAASIPVSLAQALKNGVTEQVAKLVIPLCATIHLSGSALKIVSCCVALMLLQGISFDLSLFAGFIFMLGVAMVAAPGVPGGAIMAAIGLIASILGFDSENQALVISLYVAMDSFGTAGNVTGDTAIAIIVDNIFGKKNK